jgi:DNA-binding response OmpR family regulator
MQIPSRNSGHKAHVHCPTCGQIIPPRNLFRDQPIKRRIFEYIAAHPEGVTRGQIVDHVWAHDPNGGPGTPNIVCVHVAHMRPTLEREGLTISSARGPGSNYRLVSVAP